MFRSIHPTALVALLVGAFGVFGFAPFDLFPLTVLVFAAWFGLLQKARNSGQAAWLSFAFGLGYFVAGVGWVFISLNVYGGMPWWMAGIATGLFCGYLALFPALAGWLFARLRGKSWPDALLLWPALVTLTEWLRGWLMTGFPWLSPGYSQAPVSPLAGFAPVLGVYGLTFFVALSAGLLFLLLFPRSAEVSRRVTAGLLVLVWSVGGGLAWIDWTQPTGKPMSVALLQGNIAQEQKWQESLLPATFSRYLELTLQTRARLIVLPETAFPLFLHDIPADYLRRLEAHAKAQGGDVLIGVPEMTEDHTQYYNTMLSFGVSPSQRYRKTHLVPFGEFIPFKPLLGPWYRFLDIPLTDFARGGSAQKPLQVAGQRVLVNICYEDVFGEELLSRVPQATLLLNISNDAWYGRSAAAMQHMQISQLRALETGRYMLRSTNTGMTAIIDQHGYVRNLAPWFKATALAGTAQGFTGQTPYTRWGNSAIVNLMLLLLLVNWRSSKKADQ